VSLKTQDSTVSYLTTGTVSSTRKYAYNLDYSVNPIKITDINSSGDTMVTHFKYPREYIVGASPSNATAQGIKNLVARNIVSVPIETYVEHRDAGEENWTTISGQYVRYKTDIP